jgi:GntR family transcriptional repressor for pyruvate dehydrogenase complex
VPDEVAERILARILDGTFPVGERLPPERELAEELRVNRSSLREALKKLEQLRLVDIQQGSGTRVQSSEHASFELVWATLFAGGRPNLPWIRDLLELRDALLPGMLRIVVERATAAELGDCVGGLSTAADPERSDAEFLEALVGLQTVFGRATRNRVVQILANTLERFLAQRGFLDLARIVILDRRSLRPLIQRLAVALEARDADTVERSARDLMRRLSRRTLESLDKFAMASESADGG